MKEYPKCKQIDGCRFRMIGYCEYRDPSCCPTHTSNENKDVEHQRQLALERWAIEMVDIYQARMMNDAIAKKDGLINGI